MVINKIDLTNLYNENEKDQSMNKQIIWINKSLLHTTTI